MKMKQIKKAMLKERIRFTSHTRKRMEKRGYTNSDIISCIWSGDVTKIQFINGKVRAIVEGLDMDRLPIVLIVGKDSDMPDYMVLISVFPPIKEKFKRVI